MPRPFRLWSVAAFQAMTTCLGTSGRVLAVSGSRCSSELLSDRCTSGSASGAESFIQRKLGVEARALNVPEAALSAGPSKPPSFCVLTRLILQELPYLRSFFRHYSALGINTFYALSNEESEGARASLEEFLAEIPARIVLQFRNERGDEMIANGTMVEEFRRLNVTEDFVVNVDIDEFWVLPKGISSFAQLVGEHPADLYYAKWHVVVNDQLSQSQSAPLYAHKDNSTKWMVRRGALKSVDRIHRAALVDTKRTVRSNMGFIAHFWSRSFYDTITKGVAQEFATQERHYHGCEGLEQTRKMLAEGILPERLRMLALLANAPREHPWAPPMPLFTTDLQLEHRIAVQLLGLANGQLDAFVEGWHVLYVAYKACVQDALKVAPLDFTSKYKRRLNWLDTNASQCGSCSDAL